MAKHAFTNITTGMKGLHTVEHGLVWVDPGVTTEKVTVSDDELPGAKETGWWEIDSGEDAGPADTSGDLSKKTVAELKVIAAAETVTVADDAKKADLVAAIEAHRAANPPPPA